MSKSSANAITQEWSLECGGDTLEFDIHSKEIKREELEVVAGSKDDDQPQFSAYTREQKPDYWRDVLATMADDPQEKHVPGVRNDNIEMNTQPNTTAHEDKITNTPSNLECQPRVSACAPEKELNQSHDALTTMDKDAKEKRPTETETDNLELTDGPNQTEGVNKPSNLQIIGKSQSRISNFTAEGELDY